MFYSWLRTEAGTSLLLQLKNRSVWLRVRQQISNDMRIWPPRCWFDSEYSSLSAMFFWSRLFQDVCWFIFVAVWVTDVTVTVLITASAVTSLKAQKWSNRWISSVSLLTQNVSTFYVRSDHKVVNSATTLSVLDLSRLMLKLHKPNVMNGLYFLVVLTFFTKYPSLISCGSITTAALCCCQLQLLSLFRGCQKHFLHSPPTLSLSLPVCVCVLLSSSLSKPQKHTSRKLCLWVRYNDEWSASSSVSYYQLQLQLMSLSFTVL